MGNFAAIHNMLKKCGIESVVSNSPDDILKATKIILPGVGSFDFGIKNLERLGMVEVLKKKIQNENTPILGVCLGMQLLTNSSEEGTLKGLGFIDASTIKFNNKSNPELKIPSMGWNSIRIIKNHQLTNSAYDNRRFYFVHSYYVVCNNYENVIATSNYGIEFTSVFQNRNVFGVQFHPEKSHKFGMELLSNFAKI